MNYQTASEYIFNMKQWSRLPTPKEIYPEGLWESSKNSILIDSGGSIVTLVMPTGDSIDLKYVEASTTLDCSSLDKCLPNWKIEGYEVARRKGVNKIRLGNIKEIIFNPPATIVIWKNGDKTVVKAQNNEEFDPEKGLAMALVKYHFGNKGNYFTKFRNLLKDAIWQKGKE